MCLAVPAQLVSCDENEAVADLHGNRVRVSTLLVPEVKVGDWVLIHAGFAIQHLDAQEAQETFAVLEDLGRLGSAEGPALPRGAPCGSSLPVEAKPAR
jgi:hydrogenase expression/formation protein HypC